MNSLDAKIGSSGKDYRNHCIVSWMHVLNQNGVRHNKYRLKYHLSILSQRIAGILIPRYYIAQCVLAIVYYF